MKRNELQFEGATGASLAGSLVTPPGADNAPVAIFAHCFTCGKENFAAREITRELVRRGIGVFRFDFTGIGESGGEFAETGFSSNVEDLKEAASFLASRDQAPQLLIGHSFGGLAALIATPDISSVKGTATIAAPHSPEHLKKHFGDELEQVRREGEAQVNIGGRPFTLTRTFLEDIESVRAEDRFQQMDRPVLILHSPADKTVEFEQARRIFDSIGTPASFISLDGAAHLLPAREDARYAGRSIAAWAPRYVDLDREEESTEHGQVRTSTGTEQYMTAINAGGHRLVGDEPAEMDGQDMGPTPYGFLLAGLGSCTGITLRMYADRKEWPLEEVNVELTHEKIHAEDCEDCETEEGKVDRIVREIALKGDLTEDQRSRLLEIANRCPVHRTLDSETRIETRTTE